MSPYTPAPIVEIAFGYGPFHATPVWTDVSSYVKSATLSHGRSSELDNFTAGTMTIVLKNDTRLFDPLYSAGTYYGQLLPNVPVRVRALKSAVYYSVWRGFADGFEVTPGTITSECVVSCTDAFGILATKRLPQSVYDSTVVADSPRGYWQLGSDTGDIAADISGNNNDGTFYGIIDRNSDSISPYGSGGSMHTVGTNAGKVDVPYAARIDALPVSVELWVKTDNANASLVAAANTKQLYLQPQYTASLEGFSIQAGGESATDQFIVLYYVGNSGLNGVVSWNATVCDGNYHHVVVTIGSSAAIASTGVTDIVCYVDSVPRPVRAISAGGVGGIPNPTPSIGGACTSSTWDGSLDDCAVYPTKLTAAQVLTHYTAATKPWDGDTTGGRITRVLDLIGWPSALRSIDGGEFLVGPAKLNGRNALEYLQSIAQSEQGRLFVDASGKITFHQRDRFLTQSTETTVQYTFSDAATGIMVDPSLRFTLDKSFLYNEAQVTRDGGEAQSASNSTSITSYGPRTRSLSGLVLRDDRNARSIADYIVYRYKTPQVRASAWTVVPELKVADWASILGLEIGHRIKLAITPQSVGSATTTELHIESIAHVITEEDWRITFTGSPTDNSAYLLWGSGLWGTGVWR